MRAGPDLGSARHPSCSAAQQTDVADQIRKLAELLDAGMLTDEEFSAKTEAVSDSEPHDDQRPASRRAFCFLNRPAVPSQAPFGYGQPPLGLSPQHGEG